MKSEQPMPGLLKLIQAAGDAINSIKLNGVTSQRYEGRLMWMKRRLDRSETIAGLANIFFGMANAHINVLAKPEEWQEWEIYCYRLLNGDQFQAFARGPRVVYQEQLPGRSIRDMVKKEGLHSAALQAAAREIRRAHRISCREYAGLWSHGDMHMGNVIYDRSTDRARLIDFEILHDKSWPTLTRHADDLLSFLQDMAGTVPGRQWLSHSSCFLQAYGRPRVIARLRTLLVLPKGIPGFWWRIRSNFCERRRLQRRFKALSRAIDIWARTTPTQHPPPAMRRRLALTQAEHII